MYKIHAMIQKLRWVFDPSRIMIRLLGLSRFEENQKGRGLIMIQIDGLSYDRFHQAIKRGYLPFLKKLRKKEGYRDWHHYSGVPSCTPAIQAELFYGVKQAVPAFKFKDGLTNEVFTFYDSYAANTVEKRLEASNQGLLRDGSSYSNIFGGGAKNNAHFCAASIGWNAFFKALNPYSLAVLILFNLFSILRTLFYGLLEFMLAAVDSVRGTWMGFGFKEEFLFILSRLVVTVALRELTTLGVRLDVARGLPVIHANFFAYDDQAHRRGPNSKFAFWALPGIDASIRRIWNAAQNSLVREYSVWIYSDHGQEEVLPYAAANGESVEQGIARIFQEFFPDEKINLSCASNGKSGCCHAGVHSFKPAVPEIQNIPRENCLIVNAQGPVGFVYAHRPLKDDEKEKIATAFIQKLNIPLVINKTAAGPVYAYSCEGRFELPEGGKAVLGEDHPYLEEAQSELKSLAEHSSSGDFVISGWKKKGKPISFPKEFGSHAGPGSRETDGFALLPHEARINKGPRHLRPSLLREAALEFLRGDEKYFYHRQRKVLKNKLRVMTYNVHRCSGMDGKISPERIARVIARHDPDIVALQELDSGRARTQNLDQAHQIARHLDMEHHFHSVITVEEEKYGNAVLSRLPMSLVKAAKLPRYWEHIFFEPRGAMWMEFELGGKKIQLLNTHLSFWGEEQKKQAQALCGPEWLGARNGGEHVILCGDFNAAPHSHACGYLRNVLDDAQLKLDSHRPLKTLAGHLPLGRIDHIFISPKIKVLQIEVPSTRLERLASDHLPLIADVLISEP